MNSAWAAPTGEVFIVGTSGALLRCSGTTCSPISTNVSNVSLYAVTTNRAGELWLGGTVGSVIQCVGTACATIPLTPMIPGSTLHRVYCSVDSATHIASCSPRTSALPSIHRLTSVWASGPGDAWIVSGLGAVMHCDAQSCSQVSSGYTFTGNLLTSNGLMGVIGLGAGEIWAVGALGTVIHHAP